MLCSCMEFLIPQSSLPAQHWSDSRMSPLVLLEEALHMPAACSRGLVPSLSIWDKSQAGSIGTSREGSPAHEQATLSTTGPSTAHAAILVPQSSKYLEIVPDTEIEVCMSFVAKTLRCISASAIYQNLQPKDASLKNHPSMH